MKYLRSTCQLHPVKKKRKTPKERRFAGNSVCADSSITEENLSPDDCSYSSVGTQTERMYTSNEVSVFFPPKNCLTKGRSCCIKGRQSFRLENVKDDESKICFTLGSSVHLNIPPFLRSKQQFSEKELIRTCRIASLRIHVERAIERIKKKLPYS